MTGFRVWHNIMAALGLLARLTACAVFAPLVVLGHWYLRYEGVKDGTYLWWYRSDIGTAGLHLLACLAWTVAVRLLTLGGCA